MTTALVPGGGGITGIAWELGIPAGLAEAGIDLTDADRVIGTSAGSVVGVQITSGTAIADLYATQLAPPDAEIGGRLSRLALLKMVPPYVLPGDGRTKLARVGKLALRSHQPGSADREGVIRSRIHTDDWPDRDLRITAVEAESGEFTVFTPRQRGRRRQRGRGELRGADRVATGRDRRQALHRRRHALDRQRRHGGRRRARRGAGSPAPGPQQEDFDPRTARTGRTASGASSPRIPRRWPPSARTSSTRPSVPMRPAPGCASRPTSSTRCATSGRPSSR
ncbi:hypothetical protein LP418_14930 [Nocardioides sp. B-3]|nr:hypothetical protein [Nocardioides sp. B-3]UUZ57723.1 hypothetical protein LP418_14930 [Nocardioides sp. B-3]